MQDHRRRYRRILFGTLGALLATLLIGQASAAERAPFEPPLSAGAWHRLAAAQRIAESDIFDYMDGEGELYLAYRFKHLAVYRYQAEKLPDIVAEIYFMETPADAFGLLSQEWRGEDAGLQAGPAKAPARAPAARALYSAGLLRIAVGTVFMRVLATQETPQAKQAVLAIGRAALAGRPYLKAPSLLNQFPLQIRAKWRLMPDQTRFMRSSAILNTFYYVSLEDLFNLDAADEAAMVVYENRKDPAKTARMRLLLLKYATAAKAAQIPDLFAATYLKAHQMPATQSGSIGDTQCFQVEDGWMGFRRKNRFMAFVFQSPDARTARKALAAVAAVR